VVSASLSSFLGGVSPALLSALAALAITALLTVTVRAARWARLRWRARSPRVQIASFAWAAPDDAGHEAKWVTSLFREQLSNLRLDPLDPLPERAPGAPMVEIIEGVGQGIGHKFDLGTVLGRLYRSAWPDAAYEVWGTLRPLHEGGGRISVQLVDRARGNRAVVSAVSDRGSWEEGAAQAAMAVAGGLYPRVAKRYKGPWTCWSKPVPCELVQLYHEARQHEAGNRPEQSLGAYHEALERDPLNPHLRLKIAMLQERLGLDLDAWVTYNAIIDESDRKSWMGPDRKARLLALFRLAVLLCNGRIAKQWVDLDEVGAEERARRRELRMALTSDALLEAAKRRRYAPRRPLVGFQQQLAFGSATVLLQELPSWEGDAVQWVEDCFGEASGRSKRRRKKMERQIKEALEIIALRRLEELDSWLRARPPLRGIRQWSVQMPPPAQWLRRSELSRAAVRLSKRLTRLRIAASAKRRIELGKSALTKPEREESLGMVREAHLTLTRGWPFPPTRRWSRLIRWIGPRRRWADGREDSWQLHYNAACTAASTLLDDSLLSSKRKSERAVLPGDTHRDDVIDAAMAELEEYAHRAGSSRVAEQSEWLALEDPDLAGLFETNEFRLWAGHHLPWDLPDERPNRDIDVERVAAQMLQQGAIAFAKSWEARAAVEGAPPEAIAAWWREERSAWRTLLEICSAHRGWRQRLNCLLALQKCLESTEGTGRIDFAHARRDRHMTQQTRIASALKDIRTLVGDEGAATPGIGSWVHARAEQARLFHEDRAMGVLQRRSQMAGERGAAMLAASIWDALAEGLAGELRGTSDGDLLAISQLLPPEHRLPPAAAS
jgi:hypothetical protein